jgi:hypothetical protein
LLPSNNLETDRKENMSRGVYRVFPSGLQFQYIILIPYILDDYSVPQFNLAKELFRTRKLFMEPLIRIRITGFLDFVHRPVF